ncbi:Ig-like domain-containing protein [Kosakonia sacchari]|uniref:Ig-like domain-containing protein n=1 Tax=Kosakonia sacchari TaxID=1158459 RepID=UPI002ACD2033|nr:Ig-like domain-containing protein [Kosakonia sacchari]MDZ7320061.1 Ig-like domain-containing protein [Kosakonia sacchari]
MNNAEERLVSFTLTSTNTASPNGSDTNIITAKLANDSSLVSGVEVTLTVQTPGASFSNDAQTISGITNPLGEFSAALKSTTSPVTVFASCYLAGNHVAFVDSVFNGSGSGGNEGLVLTSYILQDNAVANSGTANTILYTLMRNGIPVAGEYITFTSSSTSGKEKVTPAFGQTDSSGYITVTVTDSVAEPVMVKASVVTANISETTVVTFAEPVTEYQLTGTVITNDMAADGKSRNHIRFTLTDGVTQQPVPYETLVFTGSGGLGLVENYVTTDISGHASVYCVAIEADNDYAVTGRLVSDQTVSATVNGIRFSDAETFDEILAAVTKDHALSNGLEQCVIEYKLVKNALRDVISNQKIYINVDRDTAIPDRTTLVTDNEGKATLRITNTEAQAVRVHASTDVSTVKNETVIHFAISKWSGSGSFLGPTDCLGVNDLTGSRTFIQGHKYRFKVNPGGQSTISAHTCKENYTFIKLYRTCVSTSASEYNRQALFEDFSLYKEFVCTRSGPAGLYYLRLDGGSASDGFTWELYDLSE